jgi:hypothetical protein
MLEQFAKPAGKGAILVVALLAYSGDAYAQMVDTEPADTAGNRVQPAYDPVGIRRGPITIWPSLAVTGTYDSNVFAREDNAISDFSLTMVPSVRVTYDRPRANASFTTNVRLRRYATLTEQDDEQYRANLRGDMELGSTTRLGASLGWARSTVSRGSSENGLQNGSPLRQSKWTASTRLSTRFNRLAVTASADAERFRFNNVRLDDGTVIDQSFRNGSTLGGALGLAYSVGPRFALVAQGSATKFDYRDPRPTSNRDAMDYSLSAGGRYEITELLFAELTAGIREHDFRGAAFTDVSGLALSGRLRWYPTPLLSLRADLGQRVTTSSFDSVSAVTITSAKLSGDYELRRNLLLSADAEFSNERFSGVGGNSQGMRLGGGAEWKANRWFHLEGSLHYERRTRSVEAIAPEYDGVRVLLTARIAR